MLASTLHNRPFAQAATGKYKHCLFYGICVVSQGLYYTWGQELGIGGGLGEGLGDMLGRKTHRGLISDGTDLQRVGNPPYSLC
jgi:hypothetical protein